MTKPDATLDKQLAHYQTERNEAVEELLKGVPAEGGSADRETLEHLIRTAFNGGVLAVLVRQN